MPKFELAHIREQGVDLIVIPLDDSFRLKSEKDKNASVAELQARAASAGLAGTVVPVWGEAGGRMAFLAPQNFHSYFKSIDLLFVAANINRELHW
jgi:hypothetical protein